MALPTPRRCHDIKTFKMGSDDYGTIKEVSWDSQGTPLYDSGDDDSNEVLVGDGMNRHSFSIVLSDGVQAAALKAHAAGNIVFNGLDASNTANLLVTLTNAKIFQMSGRAMHAGVWGWSLSGRCDGVTQAATP